MTRATPNPPPTIPGWEPTEAAGAVGSIADLLTVTDMAIAVGKSVTAITRWRDRARPEALPSLAQAIALDRASLRAEPSLGWTPLFALYEAATGPAPAWEPGRTPCPLVPLITLAAELGDLAEVIRQALDPLGPGGRALTFVEKIVALEALEALKRTVRLIRGALDAPGATGALRRTGHGAKAAREIARVAPRDPRSVEEAVLRVVDRLDWGGAARAVERSKSLIKQWAGPASTLPLWGAVLLDRAFLAAACPGEWPPPLLDLYQDRLAPARVCDHIAAPCPSESVVTAMGDLGDLAHRVQASLDDTTAALAALDALERTAHRIEDGIDTRKAAP